MKEMHNYQTSSESDSSSLSKSSKSESISESFSWVRNNWNDTVTAGLHFASLPHVQILNGRKTISYEESKHAPFFCRLIYIVHIYRQQNLHFPATFISIDTWCPISIKSVHRIVIDKYNTEVEHSNHMVEWTLTKSDNLLSDCCHHTPKRGWPGHLATKHKCVRLRM